MNGESGHADPMVEVADALAIEMAKARKLEIIFGAWWRHYAVPYEFPMTLRAERGTCPYCGVPLGKRSILAANIETDEPTAQLDHMDPVSRGGEDSIRNTVFACRSCNSAKGSRLFVDWLQKLAPAFAEDARRIYTEKHGHAPEAFVPSSKRTRLTLPRLELGLDETVIRALFPKPMVSGPPRRE